MTLPVAPARILLVGSGGREHALAWRLAGEPGVTGIVVAPGSAGIGTERGVTLARDVDPLDGAALVALARRHEVDLVIVGPEAPLAAGVADALVAAGIPVFGPSAAAARIESSKSFCRDVAEAAGVRMARGASFTDPAAARAFARELVEAPGSAGVVVKADGLASGKGVTVCDDLAEAEAALAAILGSSGARAVVGRPAACAVVEERLEGDEASLIALCDGSDALALPAARDHKRLLDGDEGPNTGGMGAISPLPEVRSTEAADLVARFHRPVLAELARRGTPFRGALYAGLMLTDEGPVLLEFNARFGDPETQVILPLLDVALGPLLLAAARGELAAAGAALGLADPVLPSTGETAIGVVLAAAGYPGAPVPGDPIEGIDAARATGALVFHAGTSRDPDGTWRTAGGRVLSVVALGRDLEESKLAVERAADLVRFDGAQRRSDIGVSPWLLAMLAGEASR